LHRVTLLELNAAAPLTILMGAGLGAAFTQLMIGPLGQSSDLSLAALALIGIQVIGPAGVVLIWVTRCAPERVAHGEGLRQDVATAILCVIGLLPYFLGALVLAGMLLTPRDDLASEVDRLMGSLDPLDLLLSLLNTALCGAAAALVCLRKAAQLRRSPDRFAGIIADAIAESFAVVVALQLLWATVLKPFHVYLR
jgi:hypothetical protein